MHNCFIYKLNKNLKNEFILNISKEYNNYFIIEDVDSINPLEIIRLLKSGRKIIFGDFSIIDTFFLKNLKELLLREKHSYMDSLFISKESYIKTQSFRGYSAIIKELEFNDQLSEKDIFLSDKQLRCSLKIKDLYNKNKTIKKIDQSTFLKNMLFEKFLMPVVTIENEIKEITDSVIFFKKYLVESVVLFFEKNNEKNICFSIDRDFTSNYKLVSSQSAGIVSAIDFDKNSRCLLNASDLMTINIDPNKKVGWIDIVKIKNIINTLGIEEVIIENLDLYNNLTEIKVCSEYGIKNYSTKIFCSNDEENILPFYIRFDGWNIDILKIANESEIPIEFLYFLNEIKKLMGVKVISAKLKHFEVKIGN